MAGSIDFPSGLQWSVGSTLFDAAIVKICEVGELDEGAASDALRSAGQLGWLVFDDIDEPARCELLSIVRSELFRDQLIETFADGTVLDDAPVRDLVNELHATAKHDNKLPNWLRCHRNGIIIKGLLGGDVEGIIGSHPWPLTVSRVGDAIRYEMFQSRIIVDVEFGGTPSSPHEAAVVDVGDARFAVSGQQVEEAVLAELAALLAQAHNRTN